MTQQRHEGTARFGGTTRGLRIPARWRCWMVGALIGAVGCAPSPQAAPAVVVVAPVATGLPRDLVASPTTPTRAPGADCTTGGLVHMTIAPLTNETGRPTAEIEAAVMPALEQKLAQHRDGLVLTLDEHVAGRCENHARHGRTVAHRFDYQAGNLRVRLSLGVRWRTDGSPIGSVRTALTKENVFPDDHASELQLLRLAAELGGEKRGAAKPACRSSNAYRLALHYFGRRRRVNEPAFAASSADLQRGWYMRGLAAPTS